MPGFIAERAVEVDMAYPGEMATGQIVKVGTAFERERALPIVPVKGQHVTVGTAIDRRESLSPAAKVVTVESVYKAPDGLEWMTTEEWHQSKLADFDLRHIGGPGL
jgi:hypothetical protein